MELKNVNYLNNTKEIQIPTKLPLLESLCWNIKNPYELSLKEMLSIYEERWKFNGVLNKLEAEESQFIQEIITLQRGLPLVEMNSNNSKKAVFTGIKNIIRQLDVNLFNEYQVVLGGGALIGLLHQQLRYSNDLDFLVAPQNYNNLKYCLRIGKSIFIDQTDLEIGSPRIDQYAIRYPIRFIQDDQEITLKLEIVAEWNLNIEQPDMLQNIPCLNLRDRVTAKLLANVDRGLDKSKFSRDLIDLAIIGCENNIPAEAIHKAQNIYPDALSALKETIKKFQDSSQYRARCYEMLQINRPEIVINGIDYLAKKCALKSTKRTFEETDFGYLESESELS